MLPMGVSFYLKYYACRTAEFRAGVRQVATTNWKAKVLSTSGGILVKMTFQSPARSKRENERDAFPGERVEKTGAEKYQ